VSAGAKDAFEPGFQANPITSFNDPRLHDPRFVDCNTGALAQAKLGGGWFFEVDDKAVLDKIKKDTGHGLDEAPTLVIESRDGHWHFYFQQTEASIKMGNVPQVYGPFSARVNNQYVVGPDSHRNDINRNYLTVIDEPIAPAPDWFVQWLVAQKVASKNEKGESVQAQVNEFGKIRHGYIHGWLVHQAGVLRSMGMDISKLEETLLDLAHSSCEEPLDDNKIRQVARSFERYEPQPNASLPLVQNIKPDPISVPEIDTSEGFIRPEFPHWVLDRTSIGEGLVKPALASSSKHAEFIAMPAIQMMLNALSGNVRVGMSGNNLNIYVGLVSPYGKFFKSSSCDLAMDYFRIVGLLFKASGKKDEAMGRTAIIHAGSPEAFGLRARDIIAKRAILFNDELGKFVSKAGIEGSSFSSDLLSWYGSGEFGNGTTATKNAFHFEAGTYTFGWLWATTDRGFNRHWPKLAGISSGLEDRMFYVVSPAEPKPATPYSDPILVDGAVRTRQLIDKAVQQGKFDFESPEWFAKKVSGLDPRSMDLAQKLALYFCVDMGDTIVGDEHVDRALALVQYRNQAAAFLAPIEAENDGARMQKEILRELRQNRGKMRYRDLCRALDYTSIELFKWNRLFQGLVNEGLIADFSEPTTSGKRVTRMVGLRKPEED